MYLQLCPIAKSHRVITILSSSSGTCFNLTFVLVFSDVALLICSSIVEITANGQILGCATVAFSE